MANSSYNKAHAGVRKGGREMRKVDRRMGRAGQGAMDVIGGDLMSTWRGQSKKLSRGNARTLDRIMKLNTRQGLASRKSIGKMQDYAGALGGGPNGALQGGRAGGALQFFMDQPERIARANATLGRAEVKYGKGLSQNARDLMAITKKDIQLQNAAADTLMAKTNFQRAGMTAELVAQQHHEINMQEMQAEAAANQARLEGRIYRRNMEHQAEIAAGELGPPGEQTMAAGSFLMDATQPLIDRLLAGSDPATAALEVASTMGLAEGDPDRVALTALASKLAKNVGRGDSPQGVSGGEREDAILSIIRTVPGWTEASNHKAVINFIKSGFKASDSDRAAVAGQAPRGGQYDVSTTQGKDIKVPTFDGTNGKEVLSQLTKLGNARGMDSPADWAAEEMDRNRLNYWQKRLPAMIQAKFSEVDGPAARRVADNLLQDPMMATSNPNSAAQAFAQAANSPDGVSDRVWEWFVSIRDDFKFE